MGHIKKLLALDKIEPRSITANAIWGDLCENVHLHYRNIRLDFDQKEFSRFRAAMNHIGMAIEFQQEKYQYEEGDPNFLVNIVFNEPLHTNSTYYPNRISIEAQHDETVHFHYRDLRLHFTVAEFNQIADAFRKAQAVFDGIEPFPWSDVKESVRIVTEINRIQPYDEGHRPGVIDAEHRAGIDFCKELIRKGKKIRPILVNTVGQRLDGFKRYMAHKELGKTTIECIVDPFGSMGGQNNQSMIDDLFTENVAEEKPKAACQECGNVPQAHAEGLTIKSFRCEKCGSYNEF